MTTLYLIRHGETRSNVQMVFQGATNTPLNTTGLEQARLLGERFREIPLDAIYASPLLRAIQTAEEIVRLQGLELQLLDDLQEIDCGELENCSWQENQAQFPQVLEDMIHRPGRFSAPGGECTAQVTQRMRRAVEQMAVDNPNATIAAVSHGFAINTFLSWARGESLDNMTRCIVDNTAICMLRLEAGKSPEICTVGDSCHLGDRATAEAGV